MYFEDSDDNLTTVIVKNSSNDNYHDSNNDDDTENDYDSVSPSYQHGKAQSGNNSPLPLPIPSSSSSLPAAAQKLSRQSIQRQRKKYFKNHKMETQGRAISKHTRKIALSKISDPIQAPLYSHGAGFTKGSYTSLNGAPVHAEHEYTAEELQEMGFRLIAWDGR